MITEQEIRNKGFNNGDQFLITNYMQEGDYFENPHHIIQSKGEFYFRGRGHTIAKIENLQHLEELMEQYITK